MTSPSGHRPAEGLYDALRARGMSRRAFLRFSASMAALLALPSTFAPRIAAAIEASTRVPVIWLRGQACGGETASFLRAAKPTTASLLLDILSVDYQDALMAAAGTPAQRALMESVISGKGRFLAVVEGAIPTGPSAAFSLVGGRPFEQVVRQACDGAAATIALGACAVDGGIASARGGTSDAMGVGELLTNLNVVNLPGCPVNVENVVGTIVHYVTFGSLPPRDRHGRPLFAYADLIHNTCDRRAHFEFGEFATDWGDEGAQKGWCLYKLGCKGPETFSNCATVRWGQKASWPIGAGHGCIGCTMAGFWDAMGPIHERLPAPVGLLPDISVDDIGVGLMAGLAGGTALHGVASAIRDRRVKAVAARKAELAAAAAGAVPGTAGAVATASPGAPPETAGAVPVTAGAAATRAGAAPEPPGAAPVTPEAPPVPPGLAPDAPVYPDASVDWGD